MSFTRSLATSLIFAMPAIFIGLAAGFHPDAVVHGAAAAAGAFCAINYRPQQ